MTSTLQHVHFMSPQGTRVRELMAESIKKIKEKIKFSLVRKTTFEGIHEVRF